MFEIGTIFLKDKEEVHVALATKKGVEEVTLEEYVAKNNTIISGIDSTHPITTSFKTWSQYPFITRDVSFWAAGELDEQKFTAIVGASLGSLSIRTPYMIDQFSKDGRHSYAFRFVFQSYEKTLTDLDIEGEWLKILGVIQEQGFEIR
jgi:phenylalanyl-tRNA synthetase beta subunit